MEQEADIIRGTRIVDEADNWSHGLVHDDFLDADEIHQIDLACLVALARRRIGLYPGDDPAAFFDPGRVDREVPCDVYRLSRIDREHFAHLIREEVAREIIVPRVTVRIEMVEAIFGDHEVDARGDGRGRFILVGRGHGAVVVDGIVISAERERERRRHVHAVIDKGPPRVDRPEVDAVGKERWVAIEYVEIVDALPGFKEISKIRRLGVVFYQCGVFRVFKCRDRIQQTAGVRTRWSATPVGFFQHHDALGGESAAREAQCKEHRDQRH